MSFTNFLETEILDHVFAGNAYTAPATVYIALFTAAPGEAGGGTEVSGGSYARQAGSFSVSGNTATTTANVEYPTATAAWGTITHAAIFDAASAGNMLAYAAVTTPKTIASGDVFRIPTGDFDITLD